MDLTTQRRLLTLTAAGFLAIAVGGVVWALGSIDEPIANQLSQDGRGQSETKTTIDPSSEPSNRTPKVDFGLPLQASLYDRPKPPPKPAPKPVVNRTPRPAPVKKPKLDWTLTGTIIQADRSVAILTDATGKTDIRGTGEEVELTPAGILIRSIKSDKVTLDIRGNETTLRLKQSFSGGSGGRNPNRPGRGGNR